jgi:hypothetical protein
MHGINTRFWQFREKMQWFEFPSSVMTCLLRVELTRALNWARQAHGRVDVFMELLEN